MIEPTCATEEECILSEIDQKTWNDDSQEAISDVKSDETTTSKSDGGDEYRSPDTAGDRCDRVISETTISSLCPADKMRIERLFSEISKCAKWNRKAKVELLANRFENRSLRRRFKTNGNRHENEKRNLISEISLVRGELKKLKRIGENYLRILGDEVAAWESETTTLTTAVTKILGEKTSLQKALISEDIKMMLLGAEKSRIEDALRLKKLDSMKRDTRGESCDKNRPRNGTEPREMSCCPLENNNAFLAKKFLKLPGRIPREFAKTDDDSKKVSGSENINTENVSVNPKDSRQ